MSKREQAVAARPARGSALATREALVDAAAAQFNEVGFDGTDSNQIARAAGYSPGTFYRHFTDKRDIFVAVYARHLRAEWDALEERLEALPAEPLELAAALVDGMLAHHKSWRVFRGSLRALLGTDAEVRRALKPARKRQVELFGRLRQRTGGKRSPDEDLLALVTLERACDALVDGELEELGASRGRFLKLVLERTRAQLA